LASRTCPGRAWRITGREGWQILAVFQVSARAAIAIETDVLRWWRGELGLPSFLRRDQMPQGGWTETVAVAGVDLAATGDAHLPIWR
jgi:hypothetical protein